MLYRRYESAGTFLATLGAGLRVPEEANSLVLGICNRLRESPRAYGDDPPFFGALETEGGAVLLAVRTPPCKLLVSGTAPAPAGTVGVLAAHVRAAYGSLPGVIGPSDVSRRFAGAWASLTGAAPRVTMRQRLHTLRAVAPTPAVPGALRPAARDDLGTLQRWAAGFHHEVFDHTDTGRARAIAAEQAAKGRLYVWDRSGPVSMAARTRPTANGESISFVYTPPACRGKGYATACVASLSRTILASGKRFCTLFTDRANPIANRLYRKLGFRPITDFTEYRFGGAPLW